MESPSKSPRSRKIVNDENKELRAEIKNKATILQNFIHFEAAMKPHLEKLDADTTKNLNLCDEYEKKIEKLQKQIDQEQDIKKALNSSNGENKVEDAEEVAQLGELLQSLLEEKERLLAMLEDEDEQSE